MQQYPPLQPQQPAYVYVPAGAAPAPAPVSYSTQPMYSVVPPVQPVYMMPAGQAPLGTYHAHPGAPVAHPAHAATASTSHACMYCGEQYALPHGSPSWRCKACGRFNGSSMGGGCFCCVIS